jgi:hypothetical protein
MSNYPPGVTGNEYEIAGGNEFEEHFDCSAEIEYVIVTRKQLYNLSDHALTLYNEFKNNGTISEYLINTRLKKLMHELNGYYHSDELVVKDCDFSGVVLKEEYRGTVCFECPKCETTYEKDRWDGY